MNHKIKKPLEEHSRPALDNSRQAIETELDVHRRKERLSS
jgi:hypothetical protein